MENHLDLDDSPSNEVALRISQANEQCMRSCDLVVANLTPFRSPSADPGTTFELGFMRDMNPESEVAVWCNISAAWIAYHEKHLGNEVLSNEEEAKLLATLVSISTGVDDVEVLGVPVDVGRKLLDCYVALGEESE